MLKIKALMHARRCALLLLHTKSKIRKLTTTTTTTTTNNNNTQRAYKIAMAVVLYILYCSYVFIESGDD